MPVKTQPDQDNNQIDELEQLKRLLFDSELQRVETLRKHVLDPQQRITDTAEILADSINMAAAEKSNLVEALNDPVDQCIRSIVAEKPQQFADSLFPVMGPAIRKSISETLKSFVQSTNQMIEQSMSPKSLRWRWEAKRSGVPFSEIVLKHSLLYRVEEVFLIQQGSGLLIEHVSHPNIDVHDSDAISAMLTVIRDFSRDSFSADASDSLQTVEFGDRTLWIFDGPKALLACVNRGMVPETNRATLQSVLEQFHTDYSTEMEQYAGERDHNPQYQELLETCLTHQSKESESEQDKPTQKTNWLAKPLVWILLIAFLLLGYWQWVAYDKRQRTDALLAELKEMDGVVVVNSEEEGETLLIKVLQDPLVPTLDPFAKKHGFTQQQLKFNTSYYQSLDSSLAMQRAANLLDIPNTVSLAVQDQQLVLTGKAKPQWLAFAEKLQNRIPGFSSVNLDQVMVDNTSRLLQLHKVLKAPQSVQMRIDKDELIVTGTAPAAWIKDLKQNSVLVSSKLSLITHDQDEKLIAEEWLKAVALQKELDGISFYFSEGIKFNDTQLKQMRDQLKKISRMLQLLKEVQVDARFTIKGYADGTGYTDFNQALKLRRAETIRQQLLRFGINPAFVSVASGQTLTDSSPDTSLRRADLRISLLTTKKQK